MTPRRPLAIALVGWLFIAVGCGSIARGAYQFLTTAGVTNHDLLDLGLVELTGFLAALGGAYVLRGRLWARWLILAWMGFHVILSLGHSRSELVIHSVVFVALAMVFFFFTPRLPSQV
jgi:hypothetical protein